MKFRSFEEARKFVRQLGLKSVREWKDYKKSGKRPDDIPANPHRNYKNDWSGYPDWFGVEQRKTRYKKILPFNEARSYVHRIGIRSKTEWVDYCASRKNPLFIPASPHTFYQKEWKGYPDWLGTVKSEDYGKWRNFNEARIFVRKLRLHGSNAWHLYSKSGKKPDDIPSHPEKAYKKNWKGWVDWTGIDIRKHRFEKFRSFKEARDFVRSLNLPSWKEYGEWRKSSARPEDIPSNPEAVYKKDWKGLADWLGKENLRKKFLPFEDARRYVRSLGLKNTTEWYEWRKSFDRSKNIPANPEAVYKKEWKGLGDWLGTFSVANQNKAFRTFEQAREYVHSLKLKNSTEWIEFCKSGAKPIYIPANPSREYKKEWVDYFDWLGIDDPTWSAEKIKELLRGMIQSGIIYQWDEAVLYSFLLRKGLLNLGNRHRNFFRNLLHAIKFEDGRKALEEYAYTETNIPPDLSQFDKEFNEQDVDDEINTATSDEIVELLDNTDALEYGKIKRVEDVLKHTDFLESINVDEEAMKFYVNYSISQLWKNAFKDEEKTVEKVRANGLNGNKYHDEVVQTFLLDFGGTKNLQIPSGYSFPKLPLLMQRYVAYKMKNESYFGNFSGTGAGKTLSAVLASRVIDSKLTLIVCPNDVVEHWEKHISEIFPDSVITTGKQAFEVKYNQSKHQYAILNYDKFNQADSPNQILKLGEEKIDFVVLDEIHFSKIRDANVSIRRQNLDGLMTQIRKKNNDVKVLGISATPVVNNLQEGRSLLELITGKIYDDVAIRPTIPNAVTLYEKLSNVSVREMPEYPIQIDTRIIDVESPRPSSVTVHQLKSNPLSIEQILTDYRLPEIIKLIDGQTIIFTEYVDKIIEKISQVVRDAGFSFALHTGSDHSGLKRFLAKKVQVLVASRPISTGIDGLQEICNRLILNTLPWTNAQYQQLLGRLVRRGQIKDVVHVYIVKASIAGYPYDQLKLDRIKFKKTLTDCAIDGVLPEKNLVTPEQATAEAVRWLERLERGEVSTVTRRDLNVVLTPSQIEQRIRKYGEFEKLNHQFNIEKSETTHLRLIQNPEEWLEYHRQYREARKTWNVIPYEVWTNRLKELSPRLQIGDFGCGEAKILEALGDRVHSFDHVAISEDVTACDMKSVPLDDGSLDVIVFSLSLMGKNWVDYIKEAKRCLATNGFLFISETTNALKVRLASIRAVLSESGFEVYDEYENDHFTFIEARKT